MQSNTNTDNAINAFVCGRQRYNAAALRAVKAFAKSKPWRGNVDERREKFETLHTALCAAYEIPHTIAFNEIDPLRTVGSQFGINDETRVLTLHWRLSVITYFIAFGKLRGFPMDLSYKWSVTLFKRCFPISFRNLTMVNGWIVKRAS